MSIEDVKKAQIEFRDKMWDEIGLNVTTNLSTDREEFMLIVTDLMIEAEEIEDFEYVPYEGIGKQNKKIQIDGYSYSELDECLSIFISTPLTYDESEDALTKTEAEKYFSRAISFIENAEYVIQNAEESAPGYGVACDICSLYKNVEKYKIYLITDREKSKSISEIESVLVRGIIAEKHIWDITRLYELSASAQGREDIEINLSDFGIKGIPCMLASETEEYKAYLCNIPGIVLAQLYNKYGSRLLEGNVRSFLQVRGKVNKGIRATILNEPDMFFAYNNGIAATAHSVELSNESDVLFLTKITALQIVNGGQTTASLATALIKDKKDNAEENIRRIFIPMKLSIVSPENADKLIANIARYANSQNRVSDADLWSNHPFQIRMEDFSRRLVAPATGGRQYGTYWYYERANGQYNQETYKCTPKEKSKFEQHNPKNQKITKTDLAKYMHVYQMRPDIASAGGQKAFLKFAEGVSKEWEKDNTAFNEDYFKRIVAVAILFKESDRIVRRQPWYRSYKANIVEYALSKIFQIVKDKYPEYSISFKNIWQKQELSQIWVSQIEDITYVMYQYLIREDRKIENVTEWAKREACWNGAKALEYDLFPEFKNELQTKEEENEDKRNARDTQKVSNALDFMAGVVTYGSDGWEKLLQWNKDHRVLAPSELHQIQLAQRLDGGLITSEKRCEKVLKILEKCRVEGFPG